MALNLKYSAAAVQSSGIVAVIGGPVVSGTAAAVQSSGIVAVIGGPVVSGQSDLLQFGDIAAGSGELIVDGTAAVLQFGDIADGAGIAHQFYIVDPRYRMAATGENYSVSASHDAIVKITSPSEGISISGTPAIISAPTREYRISL